jgi:hypothetical protein
LLEGILSAEHIYGTDLDFDPSSGEVRAIKRVPAGYGRVGVIEELGRELGLAADRVIYVGDGSSDVHVMLHVNNHDGLDWWAGAIRELLERNGLTLDAWEKTRTDRVQIGSTPLALPAT